MFAVMSRRKQQPSAVASSGPSNGDNRVLVRPAPGALAMIAIAERGGRSLEAFTVEALAMRSNILYRPRRRSATTGSHRHQFFVRQGSAGGADCACCARWGAVIAPRFRDA